MDSLTKGCSGHSHRDTLMEFTLTFVILTLHLSSVSASSTSSVQILTEDRISVTEGHRLILECLSDVNIPISWTFQRHKLEHGERYMIRQSNTTPRSSLLVVNSARPQDEGEYICHTTPFAHDSVYVKVNRDSKQIKVVKIIEPSERQLTVEATRSFTLKCEAEKDVDIQWYHNDYPIQQSPREVITTQRSHSSVISIFSRHAVQINASGQYACADRRDSRNKDAIQISVTDAVDGKAPVKIVDLSSSTVTIMTSKPIVLRCMTDETTDVVWLKDNVMVMMIQGTFNISADYDPASRRRFSLLTKHNAQPSDSGTYTCKNLAYSPDRDSVAVTVRDEGEQVIVNSPDRRDIRNMTLQIGRPIDLQCRVRAEGEHVPEWSKDDISLAKDAPDSKYIIKSALPNELKIPSAERLDAGVYKCSFKEANTGQVSGTIVFNITLAPCIPLSPPSHGSFVHCPRTPVYGDRCAFRCNTGYKLSSKKAIFCEKDNSNPNTYKWSGEVPVCIKMTEEDYLKNIATSTSNVLLRVGDALRLHCRVGPDTTVRWLRDGRPLVDGEKYKLRNTDLAVEVTNRFDTGLYECTIRGRDHRIFGIKKFNVSTLTCPRIKPPQNGTLFGCQNQASYGEACQFRCNHKFKISGSRSRTCELAHSQTETYWTGEMTKCTMWHYDWLTGGTISIAHPSKQNVVLVSLMLLASFLLCPTLW